MNSRILPLIGLACLLLLPASCTTRKKVERHKSAETLRPDSGPAATTRKVTKPTPPSVGSNESMYVVDIQNQQNRPIARAKVMILTQRPEEAYMATPRQKTIAWNYRTPLHGRAMAKLEADGLPKFLWVGGEGFDAFLVDIPNASPSLDFRKIITVEIKTIVHLVVEDAQGMRVANGLITLKPNREGPAPRRSSGNLRTTRRTDDLGEVKFTRNPGEYTLIASKENGSCRLTQVFHVREGGGVTTIRLPATTPK